MISFVKGKVIKRGSSERHSWVDILTNSGVGYRVFTPSNMGSFSDECELYTSFQVREDSQALFGFLTMSDRDFFELLITVSGVGPKLGIGIMSMFTTDQIKSLIAQKDHESLSKVSGLGKKGSQKIVVELESKLGDFDSVDVGSSSNSVIKELKVALKTLGFSGEALNEYVKEAEKALSANASLELEELIKLVLKSQ